MPYPMGDAVLMGGIEPGDQYRNSEFYKPKFLEALRSNNNELRAAKIKRVLQIPIDQKKDDLAMGLRKIAANFFPRLKEESTDTKARKEHSDKLVRLFETGAAANKIDQHIDSFFKKHGFIGRYPACLRGLQDARQIVAEQECRGIEMTACK